MSVIIRESTQTNVLYLCEYFELFNRILQRISTIFTSEFLLPDRGFWKECAGYLDCRIILKFENVKDLFLQIDVFCFMLYSCAHLMDKVRGLV